MLEVAPTSTAAPCPKCRSGMVLAVIVPHPVATQLARHTYLCATCNRTKTYILPVDPAADGGHARETPNRATVFPRSEADNRRGEPRQTLAAPATIYDKGGNLLVPCTIRDLSKSGARIELFKEGALPQYFWLSMLPDGSGRRLCSKVWQLALIAGVRFVEKQSL